MRISQNSTHTVAIALALLSGSTLNASASPFVDAPSHEWQCNSTLHGDINLPADDAVHPLDSTSYEWWYYSSHLWTDDGREFGYTSIAYTMLLQPDLPDPVQFADSTISDVRAKQFHFGGRQFEWFAPEIEKNRFDLQIGTDQFSGTNDHARLHSEINDGTRAYVVDLDLHATKPPVEHFLDENVRYYSKERMEAEGTMLIDGKRSHVRGYTWFDHQFGPQKIALATVSNWTWLALQLEQNRELFLLVLNRLDGSQVIAASISGANCKTRELTANDFTLTPVSSWTPSDGTCSYPLGWEVQIPSEHINLKLKPVFQQQEIWVPGMDRYWEGVLSVEGSAEGRGYAELFGYCPP